MPARLHRLHTEAIRQKIQASNIIHRLQEHVEGKVELSATQVAAANSLLDRSVPKLQVVQHIGDEENPVQLTATVTFVSAATT
jgi:hypothetical protein